MARFIWRHNKRRSWESYVGGNERKRERGESQRVGVLFVVYDLFCSLYFSLVSLSCADKRGNNNKRAQNRIRKRKEASDNKQQREKRPLVSGLLFHNSSSVCVFSRQSSSAFTRQTHTLCRRAFPLNFSVISVPSSIDWNCQQLQAVSSTRILLPTHAWIVTCHRS